MYHDFKFAPASFSKRRGHRRRLHSGSWLRLPGHHRSRGTIGISTKSRRKVQISGTYLEVVAEAPRLLKRRTEHLVPSNVGIGDRSPGEAHGFFEVFTDRQLRSNVQKVIGVHSHSDGGYVILVILFIHEVDIDIFSSGFGLVLSFSIPAHVTLNASSNGELGSSLTDLGEIGSREASGAFGQEIQVHARCQRRLAQRSSENGDSGRFVGQRDVDELVVSAAVASFSEKY